MTRKLIFATFLLLLTQIGFAGEGSFARYGLGLTAPDQHSISETKFFSFGYQHPFNGPLANLFDWKVEGGGWADASHREGRKSNAFASGSVGLEPNEGPFYIHSFFGLAAMATTDSTLGSIPEFTEDIGLGFQDNAGRRMGVDYKHFSNAGIWEPNKGRDFITVMLQIGL